MLALIDIVLIFHSQHAVMLECSCHIISYLADVMNALRQSSGQGTSALLVEGEEKAMEVDSDWVEELAVEEDDSQAEDSVRCHASAPVLLKNNSSITFVSEWFIFIF